MKRICNKPILLSVILLMLVLLLCVPKTLGNYLFATKSENYIEFGNLEIDLFQTTLNDFGNEVAFEKDKKVNISSQSTQSRIVRVKNTGEQPLYTRVKVVMTGKDSQNIDLKIEDYVKLNLNSEDWIYSDGWYYYNKILQPQKTTSELTNEIYFDSDKITTLFPDSSFNIDFYAQAVQSEHQEEENVLKVVGWPKH